MAVSKGLYIPVYIDLFGHPKFKKLCRLLGKDKPYVAGCLIALWSWTIRYFPDGYLYDSTPEDIADESQWNEDGTEFVNALVSSGFLEKTGDEYFVHDWDDYGGKILLDKENDKKRKRKSKTTQDQNIENSLNSFGFPEEFLRKSEEEGTEILDENIGIPPEIQGNSQEYLRNSTGNPGKQPGISSEFHRKIRKDKIRKDKSESDAHAREGTHSLAHPPESKASDESSESSQPAENSGNLDTERAGGVNSETGIGQGRTEVGQGLTIIEKTRSPQEKNSNLGQKNTVPPNIRSPDFFFPEETELAARKSKNDFSDFCRTVRRLQNEYAECREVLRRGLERFAALAKPANGSVLVSMCREEAVELANSRDEPTGEERIERENQAKRESALFQLRQGKPPDRIKYSVFRDWKDEDIRKIVPELFEGQL